MDEEWCEVLDRIRSRTQNLFQMRELDLEFEEFLTSKLDEAKAIFQKKSEEADEDEENDDPNESFPVLLPQTPRVKKRPPPPIKVTPEESPKDRRQRPTRTASKVAAGMITKNLKETLNSKKRRPTSTCSSASSSTTSVTKKFEAVQIDTESRVHFEEPEDKRRKVSLGSSPESEENEDKDASNYPAKLLEMPDDQDQTDDAKPQEEEAMEVDVQPEASQESEEETEAAQVEEVAEPMKEEMMTPENEKQDVDIETKEPSPKKTPIRRMTRSVSANNAVPKNSRKTRSKQAEEKTDEGSSKQQNNQQEVGRKQNEEKTDERRQTRTKSKASEEPTEPIRAKRSKSSQKVEAVQESPDTEKVSDSEPTVETEKNASPEEPRRLTRTLAKEPEEAEVEEKIDTAKKPKRMTRSVSAQNLKNTDAEVPEPPRPVQARRMTRSISAQKINEVGQEPPKIRLIHPSQSEIADETLDVDDEEKMGTKAKFATLPRAGPNKNSAIKKAASSANIRGKPGIPNSMKAPSTSNLITAAKLSANKMHGGTRKITPQSPAAKMTDNSDFTSRLKNRLAGGLGGSPMKAMKSAVKPSNIVATATSFLPGRPQRAAKLTAQQIAAQKEEELRKRKEKEDEVLRRKEELSKAQREAKRKENEARQKRVMQSRQALEASKQQSRMQQEKEAKEKYEAIKQAQLMAEERRRVEQQQREEEEKKKKLEEEKRKKDEEERKKLEEKRKAEEERQLKLEAEKRKKAEEAEVKARLAEEIRQQKLKLAQLQAKVREDMNSTYNKGNNGLNRTYNKDDAQSYEITPARHELPPEVLVDPDNYDIADLKSDEETDDEDNPRKKPAKWAIGAAMKEAVLIQAHNPPDLDLIFFLQEASPNLEEIFKEAKRRFYHRTSSAVWDTAPMSHKYERR